MNLQRIDEPMANTTPAKFIREVRQELNRITWPTRKETMVSTVMVLVLVAIAAVFFISVDFVVGTIIRAFIGI
jgi:preprotein translocase subunit SecE